MTDGGLFRPRAVILMRHAEKSGEPSDRGLSPVGRTRARALADAWASPPDVPQVIFACRSTARSTRPLDTVRPLARRLGLPIDHRWGAGCYRAAAQDIAGRDDCAGKMVLVCWRHDTLPALAQAFGAQAPRWPDSLYDEVWVLTADGAGVSLCAEPQNLSLDPAQAEARR